MSFTIFTIKRIKFHININAILIILAAIISAINANNYTDQLSLNYRPIFLRNNKILIIKQDGIYTYSKDLMKIEQKYNLKNEFPSLLSKADCKHIFIFENILPKNITFIFIKNYLYIASEKGEIILKNKFSNIYLENYNILFHSKNSRNIASSYYYLLVYKKSNSIAAIDLFEYNYYLKINNFLFSNNINISKSFKEEKPNIEENFSCAFMSKTSSKDKLLACFLENNLQIKSKVYKIDIKKKEIFLLSEKEVNIKLNSKAGKRKTFISKNQDKSLICNHDNFENYNCIIYDVNKNSFSRYINYLNNCHNSIFSLNIEFIEDLKKYILYCFNSRNELKFVELNQNLKIFKNNKIEINNIQKNINSNSSNIFYNKILSSILIKKKLISNIKIRNSFSNIRKLDEEDSTDGYDGYGEGDFHIKPTEDDEQSTDDDEEQSAGERPEEKVNENDKDQDKTTNRPIDIAVDFDFEEGKTVLTKEEVTENRDIIMEIYEPGQSVTVQGDGFEIKVAPMGEKEEGKTYIDFQSCEAKLREEYGLDESAVLSVFQTQTSNTNEKSITNKVQYVVYDEDNNELDLTVCNDEKIKINYAIRNDTALDTTKLKSFGDKGIDILNSSHPFFNDICFSYSTDEGSDMVLKDRINDVYQNFSVCDSGCEYESVNTEQMTVECSCSVTNNIDSEDEGDDASVNVKSILLNLFEDSTFGVVKCINLVFNVSNKSNNIGFWLFTIIIIAHIPLYIKFFDKGISPIKEFIVNEMTKYHYYVNVAAPKKKKKVKKKVKVKVKKFKNNNNAPQNCDEMTEGEGTDKRIINVMPPKNIKKLKKANAKNIQHNNLVEQNDNTKRTETNDILTPRDFTGEKNNNLEKEYCLIQLDANNTNKDTKPLESNYHLDNYEYEDAIEYENRSFFRILYIVMLSKDNILNTFFLKFPLESQPLRICLLLFSYTSDLALNTLFYFSDNISDKYHYKGNYLFWYTLFNNLLISVISTVLSIILGSILESMIDSKDSIEDEFKEEEKKMREDPNYQVTNERKEEILATVNKCLKKLKIKMIIFVVIDMIILLFFYYFTTSFCSVYQNTQSSWISDAVVSIIISFPIEIAIALVITIAYIIAVKYRLKVLYKITMFFA